MDTQELNAKLDLILETLEEIGDKQDQLAESLANISLPGRDYEVELDDSY